MQEPKIYSNSTLFLAQQALQRAKIHNSYMEARWLLAAALDISPSILFSTPELEISTDKLALFQEFIRERLKGKPLAYIVQEQPFYELDFYVNESVLIPRPETEELVHFCLEGCQAAPFAIPAIPQTGSMLDLGTGSGCIGLSLLHARPGWELLLSDISKAALQVAEKNALRHFCDLQTAWLQNASEIESEFAHKKDSPIQRSKICLIASDLYQNIPKEPLFDLIVSNPPYIHPDENGSLDASVRDFEPKDALFSKNPVELYASILLGARKRLKAGGMLWAELSPRWATSVGKRAQELFSKASIVKDNSGKKRFVYAHLL